VGASGATYSSSDGGTTWIAGRAGAIGQDQFDSLACPSATTCVATAHDPQTGAGLTARTTSGGAAWTVRSQSEPQGTPVTEGSVTCLSTTTCLAASPQAPSITTNGGGVWQPASTSGYTNSGAVACASTKACVVWDGFETVLSSDGGRSWSRGPELGFSGPSFDLTCQGALCVAVLGGGGYQPSLAFTSTDAGQQWSAGTSL
jgi:photosystem II stability/assembly factor-like uncharacterized protein